MSEYELYDLALYGAWWRKGECKDPEERAHYEQVMDELEYMLVKTELRMEGLCS